MRSTNTARAWLAGLAVLIVLPACTAPTYDEERAPTLAALARSQAWLEKARPVAGTAFGFHCIDAWTWFMLSTWHPDAAVRARAAVATDTRLRDLEAPPQWTSVTLSYWALALRLMAHRALPIDAYRTALAKVDVATALADTSPTTRWWTLALLHQIGLPVALDPTDTFLASLAAADPRPSFTRMNAYNVYHEIAPAAGLGLTRVTGLTAEQTALAARITPDIIDVAMRSGDTDALAEALAVGAMLDRRDSEAYRAGRRRLLELQNPDGTFRSNRDAFQAINTDHYRHVVLVATFALLTSLEDYEPSGG